MSAKYILVMLGAFLCALITAPATYGQISVSKLFQDGAVLQREQPINVWGWGPAGSSVTVTLAGNEQQTSVQDDGKWEVTLPAFPAGGPYFISVVSEEQTITISDIMMGDVYLISGQSNMEFELSWSDGGSAEAAAADYPNIREFKIPKSTSKELSDELAGGSWKKANSSSSAGSFSAVGYYFAKEIHTETGVAVGLINNSYGGARIEAFMSEQMLGYDEDVTLANGETERQPTLIYNKMVHPIFPLTYKGIIWYQAESNGDSMEDALAYGDLFKTMITAYRDSLGEAELPFIWVQLPNFGQPVGDTPSTWDAWPQLRAQQSSALSLPNTGEAITIDTGGEDIHPTNKEPVGYRLSLIARKLIYGEDIVANSPRYKSNALTDSGSVAINFDYTGSGLVTIPESEEMLNAFALAGENNQFVWANAKIVDNQVLVWHEDIPEPATVRYAWEYNPGDINLYNAEGLPAAPFQAAVNPGFKIATFESARSAIETGQSTTLNWQVFSASSVTLDGTPVDSSGSLTITPVSTTTYELIAISRDDPDDMDTARVTVEVLDPEDINRTYGKPATASTYESCCDVDRIPAFAIDEDPETRWSSAWSDGTGDNPEEPNYDGTPDDEWIQVDLEAYIDIDRIILDWEAAYGSSYDIQVSYDGYLWDTIYEERNGDGGQDNILFESAVSTRYIRMQGIERATQYGYSLFEIAAYGSVSAVQPPSVSLATDFGNFIEADVSSVAIHATASDEDGSVEEVAFYVNGELMQTSSEAPYTFELEAGAEEEYIITAVATDDSGISIQSKPLKIYQEEYFDDLSRFEAEASNVTTTGQATVANSSAASGGKYMDLRDAWTLTFPEFTLLESGEQLLTIRFQLLYESPKSQYLVVNGDTVETIEFSAPDNTSWLTYATKVNFGREQDNQVAIHGFWNWMAIDYIAVGGVNIDVAIDEETGLPTEFSLSQNYPNPFNPTTRVTYELPASNRVRLQVFDITGKLISTLVDGMQQAGIHSVDFDASGLSSGVYLYKLSGDFGSITQKMTLIK